MEILKNYKAVITIIFIVLVLVLIRSTGINHFRNDAKRWTEPTINQSNTITLEKARLLSGKILLINLDKTISLPIGITADIRNIPADSLLAGKHFKIIRNHEGPILIISIDPGLSARIWMLLSQMGIKNVFIFTKTTDNEVLKYKFRPDTIVP